MSKYYDILNESFNKMLLEAQQVVIDFKHIFGEDTYEKFKKVKNRLSQPYNDISYWVRKYNEEGESVVSELNDTMNMDSIRDVEGRVIPQPVHEEEEVASNDFYTVFHVTDYRDMIALAMEKIEGFAGAYWCIAGRYHLKDEASNSGIDLDDAVKVSQASHFFTNYLNDGYKAYFVCMPKDTSHQKYCLCFTSDTTCQAWSTEDDRETDFDFEDIPNFEFDGFVFKGLETVNEPDTEDDAWDVEPELGDEVPEEEIDTTWTDENGQVWSRRPGTIDNPELITLDNPDTFEFTGDEDTVLGAFASKGFNGVEVVEHMGETTLGIVKFMLEPREQVFNDVHRLVDGEDTGELYTMNIPGERYTPFVFRPGEGGPLLTQDGKLVAFLDVETLKNHFGNINQNDIHRHGEEEMPNEEVPEVEDSEYLEDEVHEEYLKEGYYYFEYKVEESCKLKEGIAYYYIFVGDEEVCDWYGEPLHFDSYEEAEKYALNELELLHGEFDILARKDLDDVEESCKK